MDIVTTNSDISASLKLKGVIEDDMEDYGDDDDNYSDFYDSDNYEEEDNEYLLLQAQFDKANLPSGVEVSLPSLIESSSSKQVTKKALKPVTLIVEEQKPVEDLLELLQFKRFDTVDNFSDHHFSKDRKSGSKSWVKKINKEWQSLSTDLPETIFVRVSEERMDLLRAVIVGPSGTPYHDGLFVFDCQFPPSYPNSPPLVHYHSGGLRINPNLYNCGKVCLSLLGTWVGNNTENWVAGQSTMLQVLVSIQALILNEKPFFNEPGFAKTYNGLDGEKRSNEYNETIFILSLRTMIYTLRKPPEHFKELVVSHFKRRGREILLACKAYSEGALVGSDVKKFDEENGEKSSESFRRAVKGITNSMVACLSRNGTPNCDEFRLDPDIHLVSNAKKLLKQQVVDV